MYKVIRSEELQLRPGGTVKFEGASYDFGASFFYVQAEPGMGSALHKHPYPETWIICTGKVRFTVGGETIEASPGSIIVAAPEIPHKFKNIGNERLEIICIHPSPRIIQELIEE
jgi:mannose-6-phosphate isomerase-like protein (cupin superfamily)